MATHPQRRKRNRHHAPASIAPWPIDVDPRTVGVDAVDPATDPDAADLVTATGITLDPGSGRRIPVTVWRVAATDHVGDRCGHRQPDRCASSDRRHRG